MTPRMQIILDVAGPGVRLRSEAALIWEVVNRLSTSQKPSASPEDCV